MTQCWRFAGEGVNNSALYEYFACGLDAQFVESGGAELLFLDGQYLGGSGYEYRIGTTSLSVVGSDTPSPGYQTSGSCTNCSNPTYDCVSGACTLNYSGTGAYSSLSACQSSCAWYDCINGSCTQNTTYNTPGNYKSLSACTAACSSTCCPAGQSCFDPNDLPCPAPLAQHVPVARLAQPALLAPTAFAVIAQVVPIQMAIVQLAQLAHKWRHLAPVGNHAKYTQVKM